MGFFDLKATCAVCKKEIGLNRYQIANKEWICPECYKKCGFKAIVNTRNLTVEDINAAIKEQEIHMLELKSFKATKKVGSYIEIDEDKKQWLIPDGFFGGIKNPKIYNYNDIISYELLEDGESITKGGLGRAVAGGLLFGGVGAVVGGVTGGKKSKAVCNNLSIKITVNNIKNPAVYINFITTSTKKDSFIYKNLYKSAQECLSLLQLICNNKEETKENSAAAITTTSNADEILKYKQLLDCGAITKEEFEAKKKQLLGL